MHLYLLLYLQIFICQVWVCVYLQQWFIFYGEWPTRLWIYLTGLLFRIWLLIRESGKKYLYYREFLRVSVSLWSLRDLAYRLSKVWVEIIWDITDLLLLLLSHLFLPWQFVYLIFRRFRQAVLLLKNWNSKIFLQLSRKMTSWDGQCFWFCFIMLQSSLLWVLQPIISAMYAITRECCPHLWSAHRWQRS